MADSPLDRHDVGRDGGPAPAGRHGIAARPIGRRATLEARLAAWARGLRTRHILALDVLALVAAQYAALSIAHNELLTSPDFAACFPVVAVVLAVRMVVDVGLGMYSRRWLFASVPDLERIALAMGAGTLIAAATWYALVIVAPDGVLHAANGLTLASFWPIELMLSGALLGGGRFMIRSAADRLPRRDGCHRRHTLLYGAGDTGALVARWAQRTPDSTIEPVGFLDDDADLSGTLVAGVQVYGPLSALDRAVAATGADALLITMPSAPGTAVRTILDAALARGLDVHTVPAMTDILDGTAEAYRVQDVRVEDLLRRPIVTAHAPLVEDIIRERTVMVTGAAGSIGSELARQVYALGPRRLILVDRAESPLYLVARELEQRRDRGRGRGQLAIHLCNVASRSLIGPLLDEERPTAIFHAAAYKHVPMMEDYPTEAAQVNIGGTLALLDAAAIAEVPRFVLVSTDKAVRPTSAMGATKRIAEMLVADYARRTGRAWVSVRFGNVLDSAGSVIPIFRAQLEAGEPLTVTDPEVTRYFMTIPEAVWLILDAAALGRHGGDLFMLDMGEPVRIVDLARDLLRLAGRDPDRHPIRFTGLRPGEKLHEQLSYAAEEIEPTASEKVLRLVASRPPANVRDDVQAILRLATGHHEERLRTALLQYVRAADGALPAPGEHPRRPVAASIAAGPDIGVPLA